MLFELNPAEDAKSEDSLKPLPYDDLGSIGKLEAYLEDLIAYHIQDIYGQNPQLFCFFQERPMQAEPDVMALDSNGTLYIFELKRSVAKQAAVNQIMRYATKYGTYSYVELNSLYLRYRDENDPDTLLEAHRSAFDLEHPLEKTSFNKRQKFIIVGCSSDVELMEKIDYWRNQGIDIDFIPFRVYQNKNMESGKYLLEFVSKPYDYHLNPKDTKGILINTFESDGTWALEDMFKGKKISTYGDRRNCVTRFNNQDYVFYYSSGRGIIAAARVKDSKTHYNYDDSGIPFEGYRNVSFIVPKRPDINNLRAIPKNEIKVLLGKDFYFNRTDVRPALTQEESETLIQALKKEYDLSKNLT